MGRLVDFDHKKRTCKHFQNTLYTVAVHVCCAKVLLHQTHSFFQNVTLSVKMTDILSFSICTQPKAAYSAFVLANYGYRSWIVLGHFVMSFH